MKAQLRLLGGRKLQSPKGMFTRPTTARVREALMNILLKRLEGCHWLDLFSGSGVMGCEALQRGAKRVVAVEKNKIAARICNANLSKVSASHPEKKSFEVINVEAISWLKNECIEGLFKLKESDPRFDLIYLDPPYSSSLYSSVLEKLLIGHWLRENHLVICEHASEQELEIPDGWITQDKRFYGSTALTMVRLT